MLLASALILVSSLLPFEADNPGKPKLRVVAKRVDFGELIQGDTKDLFFELHNDGDAALEIVRATPTCGCLTVDPPQEKIAPGQSIRLPVEIDTGRLPGGEVTKMVMLVTNDRRAGQIPLEVHGTVITLLSQIPEDLVAKVFPGETPRFEARLSAATPRVAALLSARMTDPRFRATLELDEAAGGRLIVEGPADDGPRHLGLQVEIAVRMKDGTTRATKVNCRVEYRSRWELSERRQITFPKSETAAWESDPSTPLVKTIELRAVAPEFRVEVKSVTIAGAPAGVFDCRVSTVEPGLHYRIEVRLLRPVEKRFARGELIVRTNDPKTPTLKRKVRAFRGR